MRRRGAAALAVVIGLGWVTAACGGDSKPEFPEFSAPLVDEADQVPAAAEQRINAELLAYQRRSTNQIAVAVVSTLGNASLEDYTNDLFAEWEIGRKKEDNGVLLLIAVEERDIRIETGSGVEGDLTDVESNRIIEDQVVPRIREGDFAGAIADGTQEIRRALGDTDVGAAPPVTPGPAQERPRSGGGSILPLIIGGFFLLSMVGGGAGRRRHRRWGMAAPIIWGGGFGGGGFGGGGFGGGGGGFGGGGGGGSSGGGASGGW